MGIADEFSKRMAMRKKAEYEKTFYISSSPADMADPNGPSEYEVVVQGPADSEEWSVKSIQPLLNQRPHGPALTAADLTPEQLGDLQAHAEDGDGWVRSDGEIDYSPQELEEMRGDELRQRNKDDLATGDHWSQQPDLPDE